MVLTNKQIRAQRLAAAKAIATHSSEEWFGLVEVLMNRCVRCGIHRSELNGGVLTKDHIIPIYQGGSDGIDNIQPMCRNCNGSKGPERLDYRCVVLADWKSKLNELLAGKNHA